MRKIKILLVDDHKLFREALSSMIDLDHRFTILDATDDTEKVMAYVNANEPDVILMDINMSPMDGYQLTENIIAAAPDCRVVALSMHSMPAIARRMLQIGARAYVTKNSSLGELMACIESVHHGKRYICEEIRNIIAFQELDGNEKPLGLNALSERELLITRLIKDGLSSRDIALQLELALKTIEAHRYNILKKLKLKNTAALVNFTNFHGL